MALDTQNTSFDYFYDLTPGVDLVLFQASQQLYMFYYFSGGSAYCYVGLAAGGYSVFGALGLTAAQLQSAVYLY
jgi:hypothetical protein